jgi:hypothetical protein
MKCSEHDIFIDHINHIRHDNRKNNLRHSNVQTNTYNTPKKYIEGYSSSKYKGVSKVKNRFHANLNYKKKRYYLGSFKTQEEAARAYDAEAKEKFKEFAWLNFPDEYDDFKLV